MPITPNTAGGAAYTVTDSKSLIVTLTLPLASTGDTRSFEVRFPAPAAGVGAMLLKDAASLPLLPAAAGAGGIADTSTFVSREVDAVATTSGSTVTLTVTVKASSAPATDMWELRLTATTAGSIAFSTTGTATRIMCDPLGGFTIDPQPGFAAGHAVAQSDVTLTANPPSPAATPTVVGSPVPPVTHRWSASGPVALGSLPACSPGPIQGVSLPQVTSDQTVTITKDVWYEGGCPSNVGRLRATASATLVIEPQPTVTPAVHSTVGVDTWVRT